jgi:multicomponent Na+:H+ antiporter subunit E
MMMRSVLARTAMLVALWGVLTGAAASSWPFGGVTVALAVAASLRLHAPGAAGLSLVGLLSFLLFFLAKSVKGGAQVAAMALRPRMNLHPAILDIELRLPHEAERVFVVGILNLMPGTLSVGLEGSRLQLHVLDSRMPIEQSVRDAEARVAAVFRRQPA